MPLLLVPRVLDLSCRAPGIRHQVLPCYFCCVWLGTFSASSFFFSFLLKNIISSSKLFSLESSASAENEKAFTVASSFPLVVLPAVAVTKKSVGITYLAELNRALEYQLLRVVPVASQMEDPTAECHSGKS